MLLNFITKPFYLKTAVRQVIFYVFSHSYLGYVLFINESENTAPHKLTYIMIIPYPVVVEGDDTDLLVLLQTSFQISHL